MQSAQYAGRLRWVNEYRLKSCIANTYALSIVPWFNNATCFPGEALGTPPSVLEGIEEALIHPAPFMLAQALA